MKHLVLGRVHLSLAHGLTGVVTCVLRLVHLWFLLFQIGTQINPAELM